jgi:hypothetical protein
MLINFTVGNFRSFKDKKTLSLEATSISELKERVISKGRYKLLPSAVIYGANSSGKSNFINASLKFNTLLFKSAQFNSTEELGIEPFLLNPKTEKEPSFFEIEFFLENDIYRYGFTVDNKRVYEEWLYEKKEGKGRERCLFIRTEEGIGVEKYFKEGEGLEDKTRDNALFLSVVNTFNGSIAKKIFYKLNSMISLSGLEHDVLNKITNSFIAENKSFKKDISDFLSKFDLGFQDFEIPDDKDLANKIKAYTTHNKYDDNGKIIGSVKLNMIQNESSGTNKLFDFISVIYGVLNVMRGVLFIDELDAKLHPLITRKIIDLFNNPESNPQNSQLIFATHDTNLLSTKIFRRDQIWFTEKDNAEATDLYSLVEFKESDGTKVRKDRSLEKDYINGRYGAIPYIKD